MFSTWVIPVGGRSKYSSGTSLISEDILSGNNFKMEESQANEGSTSPDLLEPLNITNLIVNYVPPAMTQQELLSIFSSQGEVESCRLICDKKTKQSLGYAFVNYTNAEDAAKAVNILNRLKLQNKTLKVSYARPNCDSIKFTNLYIKGIPKYYTKRDLDVLFGPFGRVIDSKVILERSVCNNFSPGKTEVVTVNKGIGFVRFYSHEEALKAVETLDGAVPQGSITPLVVKFTHVKSSCDGNVSTNNSSARASHQPGNDVYDTAGFPLNRTMQSGWNIFVFNIGRDVQDVTLWSLFGPYGAIQSIHVIRDATSKMCKGYAFVTMKYYEDACRAIEALNGLTFNGRILQVSFKTEKKNSMFSF